MATQNIPVYKDVFRLVNLLIDYIENMMVKHRRTLGDRILDTGYGLLSSLHFAYGTKFKEERIKHLAMFQTEFGLLQTYLRIANERGWIPLNHVANLSELEAKISKQIGAWIKTTNNSERGA